MTTHIKGRGHTTVRQKALVSTCSALAAQAIGVPVERAQTSLFDDDGQLGISVTVDYPLPRLDRLIEHETYLAALGGTVFDAVSRARTRISTRATQLIGAEVGSVNVTLNGVAPLGKEARVQ